MNRSHRYFTAISLMAGLSVLLWALAREGLTRSPGDTLIGPDDTSTSGSKPDDPHDPSLLDSVEQGDGRLHPSRPDDQDGPSSQVDRVLLGTARFANGEAASRALLAAYDATTADPDTVPPAATGKKLFTVRTDQDGSFVIRQPGTHARVSRLRFQYVRMASSPLPIDEIHEIDERLDVTIPLGKCTFLVVDSDSVPVPGCSVEVREIDSANRGSAVNQTLIADETGVAEIHFAENTVVRAEAKNLSSGVRSDPVVFELRVSVGRQFQELRLAPDGDLRVGAIEVSVRVDGEPAEAVPFSATLSRLGDPGFSRRITSIEGSRTAVFTNVPVGRCEVRLAPRLAEPMTPFDPDAVSAETIDVTIGATARVEFSVTARPVVKLSVREVVRNPMWVEIDRDGTTARATDLNRFLEWGGVSHRNAVDAPGSYYFWIDDATVDAIRLIEAATGDVAWEATLGESATRRSSLLAVEADLE